jgi:transcription regulator MmyB-like protein
MSGVSESVLEALARSLKLDEAERAHLFDLARALRPTSPPRRRRAPRQRMRPSIQHVLDALTGAAAIVHNARLDNLAVNQLGHALYSDMFSRAPGPGPVNSARYVFLDPGAHDFYVDWDRAASDIVAILRTAAGRDPYDRDLSDLVGELSTQSAEFRSRWAAHNVRFHDTGTKDYHHAVVGNLSLTYNRMELAADPGLALTIWTAEPGSKSAQALSLLGSWAATPEEAETAPASDADRRDLAD